MNVNKTKTLVFEPRKSCTPPFTYAGDVIEQVSEFKYLGILRHGTKGLTPAIEYLCKAARRAMFGLQRRCQQLSISEPHLKCKLFDILVKPILCYCCEVWSVTGSDAALKQLEQVQVGFLKVLLGVQVHTKTLHVLAEFGRYPLEVTWQTQSAKYLSRLKSMTTDRVLKQAFLADCRLPDKRSWNAALTQQLKEFLSPTPTADNPDLQTFSLRSRQIAHEAKLSTEEGRTIVYRGIKEGYGCEPYILSVKNRHHRRILAQFRTGSHWLNIETGRYTGTARNDRKCPMCPEKITNPGIPAQHFDAFDTEEEACEAVEDEHHMLFDCSGYASARIQFQDLFSSNITTVGQFLNQPDCTRVAKFLIWARALRVNFARV